MSTCSPTQQEHDGQCCDFCPEGKYVSSHCNKTSDTKCSKCPHDSFMSQKNYMMSCRPCRQCSHFENQEVLKPCKENSDEQCACKEGFYCSDNSSGHCEHCRAVTVCPPGKGVSVQHTSTRDTICSPCTPGTFNNMEDYKTACLNHTNCEELGRPLLTAGTATTDAVCGDIIQHCRWAIPAGLWAGLIMTVVFGLVLLYLRTKRKSQQTVSVPGCSQSYVPPVLPPDVIEHPRSPELQTLFQEDEIFSNTCDFSLECDGMTMTTMTASEKYAYSPGQGQCEGFTTSDPSFLQSEPQEDEWPGA